MIPAGVSTDKEQQLKSLEWIRAESMHGDCLESIANHDSEVTPHEIYL